MEKQEFLDKLRSALAGRVSAEIIAENVQYYSEYIDNGLTMGESIEDIMDSLGDPRLIARSIADANDVQNSAGSFKEPAPDMERQVIPTGFKLPPIVWAGIGIVAVIAILSLVFKFLVAFGPTIAVIVLIVYLIKRFQR